MPKDRKGPDKFRSGDLNDISTTHRRDRTLDPKTMSPHLEGRRDTVDKYRHPNIQLASSGKFKALVLSVQKYKPRGNFEGTKTPMGALTDAESADLDLVVVTARIPELDSGRPAPSQYGDEKPSGIDKFLMGMHTKFVARSSDLNAPACGTLIWVSFGNIENRSDPVYEGMLHETRYGGEGATQKGPRAAVESVNKDKERHKEWLKDLKRATACHDPGEGADRAEYMRCASGIEKCKDVPAPWTGTGRDCIGRYDTGTTSERTGKAIYKMGNQGWTNQRKLNQLKCKCKIVDFEFPQHDWIVRSLRHTNHGDRPTGVTISGITTHETGPWRDKWYCKRSACFPPAEDGQQVAAGLHAVWPTWASGGGSPSAHFVISSPICPTGVGAHQFLEIAKRSNHAGRANATTVGIDCEGKRFDRGSGINIIGTKNKWQPSQYNLPTSDQLDKFYRLAELIRGRSTLLENIIVNSTETRARRPENDIDWKVLFPYSTISNGGASFFKAGGHGSAIPPSDLPSRNSHLIERTGGTDSGLNPALMHGIFSHSRVRQTPHHADGQGAEYYLMARYNGYSRDEAWWATAGAIRLTTAHNAPLPTTKKRATLVAEGKRAMLETVGAETDKAYRKRILDNIPGLTSSEKFAGLTSYEKILNDWIENQDRVKVTEVAHQPSGGLNDIANSIKPTLSNRWQVFVLLHNASVTPKEEFLKRYSKRFYTKFSTAPHARSINEVSDDLNRIEQKIADQSDLRRPTANIDELEEQLRTLVEEATAAVGRRGRDLFLTFSVQKKKNSWLAVTEEVVLPRNSLIEKDEAVKAAVNHLTETMRNAKETKKRIQRLVEAIDQVPGLG